MEFQKKTKDKQMESTFDLDGWEPEPPMIIEFEPAPELALDLDDGEVIEFELEPLKN